MADAEGDDFFSDFNKEKDKQTQKVGRPATPWVGRGRATQHSPASIAPTGTSKKRGHPTPAEANTEEEEDYFGDFKAGAHKKPRLGTDQPPPGYQDFVLMPTSRAQHSAKPTLKRSHSVSMGFSGEGDGELSSDSNTMNKGKPDNTNKPQSNQYSTPAPKHPFTPTALRTVDTPTTISPSVRASKTRRILFKKKKPRMPVNMASEEDNDQGVLDRYRTPIRNTVSISKGEPCTKSPTRETRAPLPKAPFFHRQSTKVSSNDGAPKPDDSDKALQDVMREFEGLVEIVDPPLKDDRGNLSRTSEVLHDSNHDGAHPEEVKTSAHDDSERGHDAVNLVESKKTSVQGDKDEYHTGDLNPLRGPTDDIDYFGSMDSLTWGALDDGGPRGNSKEHPFVVPDDESDPDNEYDLGDSDSSVFASSSERQSEDSPAPNDRKKPSPYQPMARQRSPGESEPPPEMISEAQPKRPARFQLTMDLITKYEKELQERPLTGATSKSGAAWFSQWPLRHAFSDDYRARSARALESRQFVPLPLVMCDYEAATISEITLEAAVRGYVDQPRLSGARLMARDPHKFRGAQTVSHGCHVCACRLWFHLYAEKSSDNFSRECEGCHMIKHCKAENDGVVPLRCFKHGNNQCHTGCQALTPLERIVYQWMAANNFASFSEIPTVRKGRLDHLDRELLTAPLVTYIVGERTLKIRGFHRHPTGPCLVPLSTHHLSDLISSSGGRSAASRPASISIPPASKAESSNQKSSGDARIQSGDQSRVSRSNRVQQTNSTPTLTPPIRRHPRIDREALQQRIREVAGGDYCTNGPEVPQNLKDQHTRERVGVQKQSLQLFYESDAGRKTVGINEAFSGFRNGNSGLMCSLCQTIFHDHFRREDVTARGSKITDSITKFLHHVLHRHKAYDESVRCDEMLSMLDRYPELGNLLSVTD